MGEWPYITVCNGGESGKMDPFTFGIVATGAFGGSLVVISLLEKANVKINGDLLFLAMEAMKFGGILYLLKVMSNLFL